MYHNITCDLRTIYFQKTIVFLLILFIVGCTQTLFASDFSKQSFAIAELSTKEEITSSLKLPKGVGCFGMSIKLIANKNGESPFLKLTEGELRFRDFLTDLKAYIESTKFVFPLFIDYEGDEGDLIREFETAGLLTSLYDHPSGEKWPDIDDVINVGKQLVVFNQSTNKQLSKYVNAYTNNVVDFAYKKQNNVSDNRVQFIGDTSNELLSLRRFSKEGIKEEELPADWVRISLNSYCIDYLLESWQISGKQPNFIFYSDKKYNITFHYLCKTLNDLNSVSGSVKSNGNLLKGISWAHHKLALSNGHFRFQYDNESSFILEPHKQGYRFEPSSVVIDNNQQFASPFNFEASALNLSDGLRANYKFNNSIINLVNGKSRPQNCNFVVDNERGDVLKVSDQNYLTLDKVSAYNIVNSSFTISVYFKFIEENNYCYCILGSNEEGFRKGLHAVLKPGKVLFGFYTNDSSAPVKLEPLKWYHLTIRYDIIKEEQSIFIDGNKVASSLHHPSFTGSSELLLGHGIKQDNYLNGYIDDLSIWDRALSDDEIKWLNLHAVEVSEKPWYTGFTLLAIGLLFIMLVFIVWIFKKKQSKSQLKPEAIKVSDENKNAIYLFGKFTVLNQSGVDYSSQFSPKIKELFLLLLISSIKNERGILTSELTKLLWPGFEANKAANNRGVTFNALKKILTEIEGLETVYEDKFWRLNMASEIYCDYRNLITEINKDSEEYQYKCSIIRRGEFVSDIEKDWLLDIKSNLNFDNVDLLLRYSKVLYAQKNYPLLLEVSEYVLKLDDLNIQGIYYQLKCLTELDNVNKALFVFGKYTHKYQTIHQSEFKHSFKAFMKLKVDVLWQLN